MPLIELYQITKHYGEGNGVMALNGITLSIEAGQRIALIGSSGSGKSTLLNIIGGIDAPTTGKAIVDGRDITNISDREMTLLRRTTVGIIFQFFNLMPTLNVLENVMLPAELAGRPTNETVREANDLLQQVGLGHRAQHKPNELSGGEMQRTAIARALINHPRILLADEPTGNLDSNNGKAVLTLIDNLAIQQGLTVIMATHDPTVAQHMGKILEMKDGKIEQEKTL